MYKTIIVLCTILAVTQGDPSDNNSDVIHRINNYININRVQYTRAIEDYDTKIDTFKEHYSGSIDGVNVIRDMLIADLLSIEDRLNSMEVMNNLAKHCSNKYRSSIPTVFNTKAALTRCATDENNKINSLMNSPLSTRNSVNAYYTTYFEREIVKCGKNYDNTTLDYSNCILKLTSNIDIYAANSRRTFNIQMTAAECVGKGNIYKALDCAYKILAYTISIAAQADILIQRCLAGKDECMNNSQV